MALAMRHLLPCTILVGTVYIRFAGDHCQDLQRTTHRTYDIQPIVQLTIALRVFATGSFQRDCGDIHALSKESSQEKKSEKDAYLRRYRHFVKKRF